jgi:hypothetical protein
LLNNYVFSKEAIMRKAVSSISLALILAAAGCTTNNNPGNGQPMNAPSTSPASTPGASSGARIQGMASSLTAPKTRSERAAATVDAIAVLAADQAYRGRVLGVTNPGPQGAAIQSPKVAEPANPAVMLQPEVATVNASITSPAVGTSGVRIVHGSSGLVVTNVKRQ